MSTPYIDQLNRRIRAGQQRECRLRKRLAAERERHNQERQRECDSHDKLAGALIDLVQRRRLRVAPWRLFAVAALLAGVLVGRYWPP